MGSAFWSSKGEGCGRAGEEGGEGETWERWEGGRSSRRGVIDPQLLSHAPLVPMRQYCRPYDYTAAVQPLYCVCHLTAARTKRSYLVATSPYGALVKPSFDQQLCQ
eukprot:387638-Rhodomonas_salina.2